MKSMLVIGGDRLGSISKKLKNEGFQQVIHVNGRKSRMVQKGIPQHVDMVLVITDYINHNLSGIIKRKAQEQGIPICFSKLSWPCIYERIQKSQKVKREAGAGVS